MNILITICARAGSKRLPNKNIKEFCGKSLIQWTIDQALDFRCQTKNKVDIVISSDIDVSNFIYDCSNCRNFFLYDRSEELCGDLVNKLDVIKDALQYSQLFFNQEKYDYVIDLDVTNPLRKKYDIKTAFTSFNNRWDSNCENLFSVVQARKIPWFNQIAYMRDGTIALSSDYNYYYNCFDSEVLDLNASIYIYTSRFFDMGYKSPVVANSMIYEMEDWQFIDIDNQIDWDISEMFFKKYILNGYKDE